MAELPKSTRQDKAKTDILNIALRMWRDPQADRFTLMHLGDYAADMRLMLNVANRDADTMSEAVALTGAVESDLVAAAVHYIEQCCLQAPMNPNRILGLQPDATLDAAKLHYRMLMKLFHPDRALIPQLRAEACAAAINQAYAQLRDKQPLIDAMPSMQMEYAPTISAVQPRFDTEPVSAPIHLNTDAGLFRKIPLQVFFWAAAVMALLLLLILNLNSASMVLTAAPEAVSTQHAMNEHASVKDQDQASATVNADPAALALIPPAMSPPVMPPADETKPTPTAEGNAAATAASVVNASNSKLVTAGVQAKSAQTLPSQTKEASSNPTPAAPGVDKRESPLIKDNAAPTVTVAPVATAPVIASSSEHERVVEVMPKSVVELSDQHLRELILQFVDSYNQGDIERFSGLMLPQLKGTEGSSQAELRETYSKLFAKSERREIVLKDLRWELHGNNAIGFMDYKASVKLNGRSDPAVSTGALKLEVRMVDQSPRISAFFNTPNRR